MFNPAFFHLQQYILEQNSRTDGKNCPFATASVEITKLLLEHTRVQSDGVFVLLFIQISLLLS